MPSQAIECWQLFSHHIVVLLLRSGDDVPTKKPPTGPREGDEFGYDPAKAFGRKLAQGMREFEETADERGGFQKLGLATGVPIMTPIKKRLLEASVAIRQDDADELAFSHTCLCQCALPTAKPPDDMLRWEQRQGRATLLVVAGEVLDPTTGRFVQLGLPYGPKSRVLLMHLNSEAIRNQSPIIPVEDTMTAFFRRLMGKTQDGRQINMLKKQLSALSAATFRMGIAYEDHAVQVDAKVVGAFDLWFNKDANQRVLWPSTLRLSLDYYESLTNFAVPLDERAISALSFSAVALDVYCWLAQRLHRIPPGKAQFIHWPGLQEQFGQGYAELRNFRPFFLRMLKQVKAAYPEAKIDADKKGLYLWQSPPPVKKRLVPLPSTKTLDLKAEEIK